jgi:hypothetical protein
MVILISDGNNRQPPRAAVQGATRSGVRNMRDQAPPDCELCRVQRQENLVSFAHQTQSNSRGECYSRGTSHSGREKWGCKHSDKLPLWSEALLLRER